MMRFKGDCNDCHQQKRRSFLLALGSMGIGQLLAQSVPPAQTAAPQGYVLAPTEGEHLGARLNGAVPLRCLSHAREELSTLDLWAGMDAG
jgi:hypothetical protein